MSEENQEWAANFPEEIRGWDEVKNSQNPEQFWQRITSHRQHIGQSIRVPSEDASVEDMNTFYEKLQKRAPNLMPVPSLDDADANAAVMKRLGVPEDKDAYGNIEGDEIAFQEGQLDTLKNLAFNAGLTPKQYEALAKQIGESTANDLSNLATQKTEATNKLKEEWGITTEDRLKETQDFLRQSQAPQNLIDAMSNTDLDADTTMWLHDMAKNIGESSEASAQKNSFEQSNKLDPYEAQLRINEMLNNREHPYHRGDERAREKMREYMSMANPSQLLFIKVCNLINFN